MTEINDLAQIEGDSIVIRVPISVLPEAAKVALARGIAEAVTLETERLCGEAQARGIGWRLWRSNPVVEDFVMTHTYKLLAPGEPPPGAGIVFGPWPDHPGQG